MTQQEAVADRGSSRPTRSRPRLHLVYWALAAFDLVTVSLSLILIDRITRIYTDSVAVNQVWAARLGDFSDLGQLAAAVNAPGNDIFNTREVSRESARFDHALRDFNDRAGAVREDLLSTVDRAQVESLLGGFDAVDGAMSEMVSEARRIFRHFEHDETAAAGERMAAMDRRFVAVTTTLAELGRQVRGTQRSSFERQADAAASLRRFEFVIAGLILLMVGGVTVYGHLLARQMKSQANELARYRDHLEALVDERTAALKLSHDKLSQAERLASIGTLAAGLGHDVHNVLFPVMCRIDAMEAREIDDDTRTDIGAIRQSLRFLQRLSEGLRMLALDPDDPDATAAATDLPTWWAEVEPLIQTVVPPGTTLVTEIAAELPAVAVPPHRLTQAVFNLVVNATEAISGTGTIRIETIAGRDDGTVRLRVCDDGPGMSEAVRTRALEPFYTTKTRGLSTGLGLAIVHGVTQGVGGNVTIDSSPGRGTIVELSLPAAAPPKPPGPDRRTLVATVSISDERIASAVTAVLDASGVRFRPAEDRVPDADLWVVDRVTDDDAIRRFLAEGDGGRRIVALDAGKRLVNERGVIPVDADGWIPGIRDALTWLQRPEGA